MSRFVEDPKFAENLAKQATMKNLLLGKAKRIADLAGTLAAIDTGNYRRSLKAITVKPGRARALTDDIAGHLIEFGGAKNVAQAPLRRAADVICDGFQRTPKPGNP